MKNTDHLNSIDFDKELRLIDLIPIFFQNKLLIISITFFISLATVLYALSLPNIYKSQAVLAPVDSSMDQGFSSAMQNYSGLASLAGVDIPDQNSESTTEKALLKLNTLSFFENNILPNIFLPDLMALESWDYQKNKKFFNEDIYNITDNLWVRDFSYPSKLIPSAQESFLKFQKEHLEIAKDDKTGFATLSVKHQSPYVAKEWADLIISQINSFYRAKDKAEAEKSVAYLNKQIPGASLEGIRRSISSLLTQEIQKLTLIEANEFYVFEPIDPPALMEKKAAPNRALLCVFGAILGAILSILITLLKYYFSKDSSSSIFSNS